MIKALIFGVASLLLGLVLLQMFHIQVHMQWKSASDHAAPQGVATPSGASSQMGDSRALRLKVGAGKSKEGKEESRTGAGKARGFGEKKQRKGRRGRGTETPASQTAVRPLGNGTRARRGTFGKMQAPRLIVVVSQHCGQSGISTHLLKTLLRAAGVSLYPAEDGELLRGQRNPFRKPGVSLQTAVKRLVADAQKKRATLVVNLGLQDQSPDFHKILRAHGARGIAIGRGNELSRLVCMVRDCFDPINETEHYRSKTRLCLRFQRRLLKMEMKPHVNTSKAYLPPSTLIDTLRHSHRERVYTLPAFASEALGQPFLPSFTSEELTAFQYKGATREELRACYAVWHRLLKSVGVAINETLIESTLYRSSFE